MNIIASYRTLVACYSLKNRAKLQSQRQTLKRTTRNQIVVDWDVIFFRGGECNGMI